MTMPALISAALGSGARLGQVARRIVASWFYQQSNQEGGRYAQVAGPSHLESFRDVYRRCLSIFYKTASATNGDTEFHLYLNKPWDEGASAVAREVANDLRRLGVKATVLEYTFRPPDGWPEAWRNQFFVYDVLRHLAVGIGDSDLVMLLDSDIVWSGSPRTADLWDQLASEGVIAYLPYQDVNERINGLTLQDLDDVALELDPRWTPGHMRYVGGEFIALRGDMLRKVAADANGIWPAVVHRRTAGTPTFLEEAHLLSFLLYRLESRDTHGEAWIRRIWTLPWSYHDSSKADLILPLWHLPAEKQYGLRRLYARMNGDPASLSLVPSDLSSLGLPRKSIRWATVDLLSAVRTKIAAKRMAAPTRDEPPENEE